MPVSVRIPAPLQQHTDMKKELSVQADDVRNALAQICQAYPALKNALFEETGELRGFVNVFVNTEDIRSLGNLETHVKRGDVIYILPSIAGG